MNTRKFAYPTDKFIKTQTYVPNTNIAITTVNDKTLDLFEPLSNASVGKKLRSTIVTDDRRQKRSSLQLFISYRRY